jgi:hypothetical protein
MDGETPRYRLLQTSYVKRHPAAQMPEYLGEGVEIASNETPGPHWEPVNATAKVAVDAYRKARPNATLDPTRHLPNGIDPMAGHTLETALLGALRRVESDGPAASATDSKIDKLSDQIGSLVAALSAMVQSPPTHRKGA